MFFLFPPLMPSADAPFTHDHLRFPKVEPTKSSTLKCTLTAVVGFPFSNNAPFVVNTDEFEVFARRKAHTQLCHNKTESAAASISVRLPDKKKAQAI